MLKTKIKSDMKHLILFISLFSLFVSCTKSKADTKANQDRSIPTEMQQSPNQTMTLNEESKGNGQQDAWKRFAETCIDLSKIENDAVGSNLDREKLDKNKIELIEISEQEMSKLKKHVAHSSKLVSNETDSSFVLIINGNNWTFNKEPDEQVFNYGEDRAGLSWYEYIAYYPDQKMHIVRSINVSGDIHSFADIYLIDKNTGKLFLLPTFGDYNGGTPVVSPDGKYMVNIDTNWDDDLGYIDYVQVLKMHQDEKGNISSVDLYRITDHYKYGLDFKELVWIDKNKFLVKAQQQKWENEKNVGQNNYYICEIPE